ncbi:hypothetical protein [Phormidesmis sp. 146-33]
MTKSASAKFQAAILLNDRTTRSVESAPLQANLKHLWHFYKTERGLQDFGHRSVPRCVLPVPILNRMNASQSANSGERE